MLGNVGRADVFEKLSRVQEGSCWLAPFHFTIDD
jgi:hypothetical protein